jgi:hypothetical protein
VATFTAEPIRTLFARYLGDAWLDEAHDPTTWERVRSIPNHELWAARSVARSGLIHYIRQKSQQDRLLRGEQIDYVRAVTDCLDPETLTLGFARRLATYKRLHLLVRDPARLERIVAGPTPVQLLISGKAHPRDEAGKNTLERVYHFKRDTDATERIVFVEDYDLDVGRRLVAGCDVWVNLPRKPMEASGTSGMKASFNGVLQLSVLDGWWAEAYAGTNGGGRSRATERPTRTPPTHAMPNGFTRCSRTRSSRPSTTATSTASPSDGANGSRRPSSPAHPGSAQAPCSTTTSNRSTRAARLSLGVLAGESRHRVVSPASPRIAPTTLEPPASTTSRFGRPRSPGRTTTARSCTSTVSATRPSSGSGCRRARPTGCSSAI